MGRALPFKCFLKRETCLERSIGNASKKDKFNTVFILSTTKQTFSDSLQASLWEVESRFILDIRLYDSLGENECVDLPICYQLQALLCLTAPELCM